MTPQERAERSAEAMWATDAASQGMGMRIERIAPGEAVLSMQVMPHHLNGYRICHGGFIFTLADSAFAFACNTYNQVTVAQENQITFLSPGRADERLTATAREQARPGRSGVYDVTVTGEDGRTVALMRGLSRTIKGTLFEEPSETSAARASEEKPNA
ncbi:MAG: hydroxyphenylacetyl-CoA thioesterase PaaI [Sagittula sp.]|jgi:acyl-CoA thioesterase|uniref:hydroxyphenylacetyl-CoA thioesterase PaaI n=1 Tax=unclassified Sagittula TaxID=2624628 RepID=UPI000C2D0AE6|nr:MULTISPECIES: hydroxyphenylacetyl-CoA thioesterase PaaI [unclassified Sagittula]AUC53310.1 phenylacetic acid degradation protein PaaD [Sagittula sp. P11]WHZ34909.1 hydroxyphenylacetyl-CoA thioesterase PaaI [Sagittula sp. MA-2]